MLSLRSSSSLCASRSRSSAVVRCSGGGDNHSSGKYAPGMKVKVTKPIKMYSVPKHPEGLDIEGMEGEVFKDVSTHKGKVLSAGRPIVVKFVKDFDGKAVKFQAHLVR